MPRSSFGAVLLAAGVFLASVPVAFAAERAPGGRREMRHRTLTIDDQSLVSLPEIHVAGGAATLLTFQVPVKEGGTFLSSSQGSFYAPTQTEKTVILVPKVDLAEPASVSVSLADGTVISFKLTSVPTDSDVQVDVALNLKNRAAPESAVALRIALDQVRGQLDECLAGSANTGAVKLAALLVAQGVDGEQVFDRHPLHGGDKQSRLLVQARWAYRLLGLTYLVFTVENRDPQRPWVFARAEVKVTGGSASTDVKVLAAATEVQSLAPDTEERLVVAFATPTLAPDQKLSVALFEKDGSRRVVLEGLSP